MYGVRDDYRLQMLERTGYADGGMSAREERLYGHLLEAKDRLSALTLERDEMEEFISGAHFVSYNLKEVLREHYREKVEQCQGDVERTMDALGMS